MDPITLIVTALAAGAAAGLSDTAACAVKDAYAGLKGLIVRKYAAAADSVASLEAKPASEGRRSAVKEDLEPTAAASDPELLRQAQALLAALQQQAPDAARTFGVDLHDVEAASVKLSDIIAQGPGPATGVAVRGGVKVAGAFEISGVRATGGGAAPAPVAPVRPRKILFLAANPRGTPTLQLGAEARGIDEALAGCRDRFELVQAHAVRVGDLQELLRRHDPDIVHFSGHGSEEGELIFEDDAGRMRAVEVQALADTFSLLRGRIRCVVLNACFSERQAQAIAAHIDCVVGMVTEAGDAAALDFAVGFYGALGGGQSVKAAFDLGCNRVDLEQSGEEGRPRLLALRCDPVGVRFVDW